MDVEFKLLDHFRLTSNLSRNFACGYSEDDRFFIINDTGIYILSLNGSLTYEFPSFACKKYHIRTSDFAPCTRVDLDINSFHSDLPREDLYETLLSVEYSIGLKHTKAIDAVPLCAEWSPRGILGGNDCVLAVLTNLHSLEVYMKYLDENEVTQYRLISNISQEIIDVERSKWVNPTKFAIRNKLDEFKKRVASVAPTAFTWSHLLKRGGKQYSVIFVSVLNGDITSWAILEKDMNPEVILKPLYLGRYRTLLGRITTMYWHETNEYEGALFYANSDGRMNVLHVSNLDQNEVKFDEERLLWTEPDKVAIEKITVMIHDSKTFIVAAKQRVLIIYGVNENGDFFDCKCASIDNYYITGIHHFDNIILALSLTGTLTQLTVSVEENVILLDEKVIPLKFDTIKYRTHGFFFTKNMVMFGLLAHPWKLKSFGKSRSYVNVFVYNNCSKKPIDIVWNNDSGSLRDYWDCFEAMRLNCLKEKRFPWLGLPLDLNYDTLPLFKLKTLRCIAKLSEMVFNIVPVVENYNMKPFILLHYLVEIKLVVNRMKRLLNLLSSGKEISEFQRHSIFIQNFFLKEMVVKNILAKANVGMTFIEDITSVMEVANELSYPEPSNCVWCGEKPIGSSCLPPHVNSRCSISMMQISLVPAYKCPYCKALAHKEIENEQAAIFCVYCDIPMEKIIFKEEHKELKQAKSDCFEDCLNENIDCGNIEENYTEYVIFTDSDDDGQCESLKELYVKFSKSSLEEIVKSDSFPSQDDQLE